MRIVAAIFGLILSATGALAQPSPPAPGGGGLAVTYGGPIGTRGTPTGFKDGSNNFQPLTGTVAGGPLITCANCSGSGVSAIDISTFTAGSSLLAPGGGFYQTTATANPLTTGQQGMFQMTAQRALFVNLRDAAGAAIGVSAAPLQVSLANTAANGTAILVTGTGGTFPAAQSGTWNITNISGTVSLPTGAATAVKQPTLGTAGAASTDVLTVQGIASGTALLVDGTGGTFPISGTIAATQSGTWNITNVSGTVSLPTGASTVAKQPALGTAGTASADVITVQGVASMTPLASNVTQIATTAIATASGTMNGGTQRIAIATDSPGILTLGPATVANSLPVTLSSQYPTNATTTTPSPITGNATGTTGAVVGTLANASSKTTHICGFAVSAIGGTAAVGPITIAGTVTSSMVYQLASTATGVSLTQTFTPCVPASAANTAITVTTTADGTASAVSVNSWGYQL